LIDDIQFLANKGNIQEEFFHTFNTLHSQGKQIVLASDRHPEDIAALGERLRSRFVWGLLVGIQPPEFATRLAILTDKAEMHGQRLPFEIAQIIAEYVEGNVRDLEGTLTQVLAYSTLMGTGLTLEMTERILRQGREPRDMSTMKRRLRVSDVIEATARCCQLSLSDLVGKSRNRDVVNARHLAIYIAREETDASLPEIGDALGRNHSTVLYSYNKIASQLEDDPELREKVRAIRERIYSATA
jgi:chromosomal replication initiator protein